MAITSTAAASTAAASSRSPIRISPTSRTAVRRRRVPGPEQVGNGRGGGRQPEEQECGERRQQPPALRDEAAVELARGDEALQRAGIGQAVGAVVPPAVRRGGVRRGGVGGAGRPRWRRRRRRAWRPWRPWGPWRPWRPIRSFRGVVRRRVGDDGRHDPDLPLAGRRLQAQLDVLGDVQTQALDDAAGRRDPGEGRAPWDPGRQTTHRSSPVAKRRSQPLNRGWASSDAWACAATSSGGHAAQVDQVAGEQDRARPLPSLERPPQAGAGGQRGWGRLGRQVEVGGDHEPADRNGHDSGTAGRDRGSDLVVCGAHRTGHDLAARRTAW